VHAFIRSKTSPVSRILYGWSANENNAADLITIPHIDGFLVWGASLDPVKFGKMIEIVGG
jgi:triosephosphate isomerase